MRRLSDSEIRQLLQPGEVLAALNKAFGEDYVSFVFPERQHIDGADAVFLSMPCYNTRTNRLGIKFVTVAKKPSPSLPTVQASYVLFGSGSAEPLLWLAANWLTDLRTAAASFLATKLLARTGARILGIFGTGRQAQAHVEVFVRLRKFERILVCGSTAKNAHQFVDWVRRECEIESEVVDAPRCAAEADIICTCTTASQPLFDGRRLRPGTHLNLVGAFQPNSREVDTTTISRARVVVDTCAGALLEAGDVLIPLEEKKITRNQISELHEIVSGDKPARTKDDEITVFKSVGCALEDLAVAEMIAAKLEQTPE